jgi:hypothetical protein
VPLRSTTSFNFSKWCRLSDLEWIEEAKEHYDILGGNHSWIWPYSHITKPLEFPTLPLLEGQGSIMAGSNVDLDSEFPPTRLCSPDLSKTLILHPIHSNFACAHPEYNPFTSLSAIPDYPTYGDHNLSVDHLLNHLSISMESPSME